MRGSLGQLIKIIRESQMETVVDKLIEFSAGKDEELRDIAGLGARAREFGNPARFIMIPSYPQR